MPDSQQILDLVDNLDAIVWEAEAGTMAFTFVGGRAEAILGYPIRKWLEEPGFWGKHIHPQDRERVVRVRRRRRGRAGITPPNTAFSPRTGASSGCATWRASAPAVPAVRAR